MAEMNGNFCVKCEEKKGIQTEKMLKCNGNCNKGLHYTCSSYNTSELQFLESNKNNIKWFCDGCSQTNTTVRVSQ
ncbi:unnamed protein product [Acanthoscelides obtectus]|uniref:PHD-type domain-containing protein n=1 Tax=Acanthoscelides obtectus TaxID=200917 RepID=A0A9P0Q0H5_ACAOB|nr:unnamed protein product [Acanthoscelides obtectus]CAK1647772.1 hypothetical protein AOBTE_LOCUS15391 [Acanthoscelides obtectus]